jgi:hypothetical protein
VKIHADHSDVNIIDRNPKMIGQTMSGTRDHEGMGGVQSGDGNLSRRRCLGLLSYHLLMKRLDRERRRWSKLSCVDGVKGN